MAISYVCAITSFQYTKKIEKSTLVLIKNNHLKPVNKYFICVHAKMTFLGLHVEKARNDGGVAY